MAARVFIAVELEPTARRELDRALAPLRAALQAQTRARVRLIPAERWHITLQFLGDVEENALSALEVACREAAQGVTAFPIELSALGAFGAPRRARVLWVGVGTGAAQLGELADRVRQQTEALGHAPESRPFAPHVTIARLGRPLDLRRVLADTPSPALGSRVADVTLFRSHPTSNATRYQALSRAALSASAAATSPESDA